MAVPADRSTPAWMRQVRMIFCDVNILVTSGPDIGLLKTDVSISRKDKILNRRIAEYTVAHERELRELIPRHIEGKGKVNWISLLEESVTLRELEPSVLRNAAKRLRLY
eukprot:PhF_6_TR34728/c0_g1_i1/m.50532